LIFDRVYPNLEYTWSLHTQNYTFRKGHRIMVQVQRTWFPIIDRKPADVRAEYLRGEGKRFQGRDAPDLSECTVSVAGRRTGRPQAMSTLQTVTPGESAPDLWRGGRAAAAKKPEK